MSGRLYRFADWLDRNDLGYGAGIIAGMSSGVMLMAAGVWSLWWLLPAAATLLLAFVLCAVFG